MSAKAPVAAGGPGALVHAAALWQRILVLLAGPAFNIMFAVLLLWACCWVTGVTEVRASVGEVDRGLDRPRTPACARATRSHAINRRPVAGRDDVMFDLLDAMSASGAGRSCACAAPTAAARTVTLTVPDAAQRRHLTEPSELLAADSASDSAIRRFRRCSARSNPDGPRPAPAQGRRHDRRDRRRARRRLPATWRTTSTRTRTSASAIDYRARRGAAHRGAAGGRGEVQRQDHRPHPGRARRPVKLPDRCLVHTSLWRRSAALGRCR